eukprot:COSAG06_NODE_1542_length_9143_cov_6.740380_10_plen_56_part_00
MDIVLLRTMDIGDSAEMLGALCVSASAKSSGTCMSPPSSELEPPDDCNPKSSIAR